MSGAVSNPAKRLHEFLDDLNREWRQGSSPSKPGLKVMQSYWDENIREHHNTETTHSSFTRWLSSCLTLPDDVIDLVEQSNLPELQFTLDGLHDIATGFSNQLLVSNLNKNLWLNDTNLTLLNTVANSFQYKSPLIEHVIPKRALSEILELVDGLLTELDSFDDMPAELRSFIVDALLEVHHAVVTYSLRGSSGLTRLLDRLDGQWRRSEVVRRQGSDLAELEKKNNFWKKVLGVLAGVKLALDVTSSATDIGSHPDAPWSNVEPAVEIVDALPTSNELGPGAVGELPPGDPPTDSVG
ncbi:hypothetical protein [Ilumatobacter sp.]|uniref:hypothetical protein n=1 Tax=Ilumatobacter sp. TaxID=1967498 RepID=UPI003B52F56D